MRAPATSSLGFVLVAASGFGLISCGGANAATGEAQSLPRSGTTVVASARMNAPRTASEIVRSCVGPSLCREDVLMTSDPEAIADVEEACARFGGTLAPVRCARVDAAAKCSGGSEYGTLTVYAYARGADASDVIARVSDQCEALSGTLETLRAELR